jgi:glycosyltransferase involved in cell wall biosynthesis
MVEISGRFAFVVPRYWPGIAGGAETLVGELAQRLSDRGDQVEIFTTCAKDNRTWENEFQPGTEAIRNLKIHRFKVDDRNLERWIPLQISISQGLSLPINDELDWIGEGVNSSSLYRTLLERRNDFDLFFFAPYLFGTTFWGSLMMPDRSCLIPCLHDEYYAYTQIVQSMFRQVRGVIFNALAEQELAEQLYGPLIGAEVGMGFEPQHYHIQHPSPLEEHAPYLLYVGRKETGKNAHLLVDYFIAAKERATIPSDLKLVIVGGGSFSDLHRPEALERGDIVDLNHVSEADKQGLMRHAVAVVQPSTNESFSIVLMESWLLGTPVLVHANCAVTRAHVVESGGGLYFADLPDFCGVVAALCKDNDLRATLGYAGKRYVECKYSWPAVLSRFDDAVRLILDSQGQSLSAGA